MMVLYGFILFSLMLCGFRRLFIVTGLQKKFWEVIGSRVHVRFYYGIWIVMVIFVSLIIQLMLMGISKIELVSDIAYLVASSACFALMPGSVRWIDNVKA